MDDLCETLVDEDKPPGGRALRSHGEKEKLIERAVLGLYRLYLKRFQNSRNWNPDVSFEWRRAGKGHSASFLMLIEGFYAVEQFVPDYTSELARLFRKQYGRSHYQMIWGAEEAKHADVWRNALIFTCCKDRESMEKYSEELRANKWTPPWNDPVEMLFYTVFQERATQLTYLDFGKLAKGEKVGELCEEPDPVLAKVATTVAVDEAAHYRFFLEAARLYLYYFPDETLYALVRVLRAFKMPAMDIIHNYSSFLEALTKANLASSRKYSRDVIKSALTNLGIADARKLIKGDPATAPNVVCMRAIETSVRNLFHHIGDHEKEMGFGDHDRLDFTPCSISDASSL